MGNTRRSQHTFLSKDGCTYLYSIIVVTDQYHVIVIVCYSETVQVLLVPSQSSLQSSKFSEVARRMQNDCCLISVDTLVSIYRCNG